MTGGDESSLYLAIDQGGHSSRALVFDGGGAVVSRSSVAVETVTPAPGRVEHDPEALVSSIEQAIDAALSDADVTRVRAAGFAAQRSSVVCWDRRSGAALSPVISWQDTRGASWLESLGVSVDLIRAASGLVPSAHYGASKLRWCLDHLPAVRDALDDGRLAWGPMASFVLFRILAERPHVVDPAIASRTLLWDMTTRDWSPQLLELFDLPRGPLPACVPSRFAYGHLGDIPLTVMTGDQSAALYGSGAPASDEAYVNIGTGAFVQRFVGDTPVEVPGLSSSVVWQVETRAAYVLEGSVNGAGSALTRMAGELGLDATRLGEFLARPCVPPLFLNGVSGLASPFWVADFESRFVGEGEPWQRLVAVAESIVFLIQANLEAMADTVTPPVRLNVSGGLGGLDGLCKLLADLGGVPVARHEVTEATARGLAWLVAGRPEGWGLDPPTLFPPRPNPSLADRYHCWRSELAAALSPG